MPPNKNSRVDPTLESPGLETRELGAPPFFSISSISILRMTRVMRAGDGPSHHD